MRCAVGFGCPGGCFGARPGSLGLLRLSLQFYLGSADASQPGLLVAHPTRRLVAAARGDVLGGILGLCAGQPLGHFAGKLCLGLNHTDVAHRLVLGGIGIEVTPPKLVDSAKIRLVQRGDRLEIQPLLARPGNPTRRVDTAAIAMQ